jgi:hypothetical protein
LLEEEKNLIEINYVNIYSIEIVLIYLNDDGEDSQDDADG